MAKSPLAVCGQGGERGFPLALVTSDSKKVLFVDDDSLLVQMLPELIEESGGYEVRGLKFQGIESADEVIRELSAGYHVLLLNIMMPGINGLKLAARIRRMGIETPIILHTGYSVFERAVEAMRVGAADLIIKPFPLEDLQLSIQGVLADTGRQHKQLYSGLSEGNPSKVVRLPFSVTLRMNLCS